MISNKPRPPDGPGSNGLRGGKKNYSARTAVGSWLDECGGPQGYSRGFHDPDFLTEAQNLQLSVTNKKLGEFGAGIKNPNGNGFTNKEVFQPPCHVDWQTNYQAMTQSKFDDKVSKVSFYQKQFFLCYNIIFCLQCFDLGDLSYCFFSGPSSVNFK